MFVAGLLVLDNFSKSWSILRQRLLLRPSEELSFIFLFANRSLAWPTWASRFMMRLFLISIDSLSLFNSTSCCAMLLLQVFKAVLWNSSSASMVFTLEDLCLVAVVGNLWLWDVVPLGWKAPRVSALVGPEFAEGSNETDWLPNGWRWLWGPFEMVVRILLEFELELDIDTLPGSSTEIELCENIPAGWKLFALGLRRLVGVSVFSKGVLSIHCWQNHGCFRQFDREFFLSVHFLWKRWLHFPHVRVWSLTFEAVGSSRALQKLHWKDLSVLFWPISLFHPVEFVLSSDKIWLFILLIMSELEARCCTVRGLMKCSTIQTALEALEMRADPCIWILSFVW